MSGRGLGRALGCFCHLGYLSTHRQSLAPIPRGFGVNLLNPKTGEIVYFDDCFRDHGDLVDGDMQRGDLAEAKGPRYAYLLSQGFGEDIMQDFIRTAQKQKAIAIAGKATAP